MASKMRMAAPEADQDADGFLDDKDKCPTEAEDKNGIQDDDGCPDDPERRQNSVGCGPLPR